MHFSIILPTIGRDSLQRAIDSVFAQTHKDWHLYIVADGCNPEIKFNTQITLIKVAGQHNDSGAFARNYGIKISGSSIVINTLDDEEPEPLNNWLCFLDDDDLYLPRALETVSNIIKNNPECSIVKTCGQMFKMGHKHARTSLKVPKLGSVNTQDIMTIGIACRRELFDKTNGWGPDINRHDAILWNEMLAAGGVPVISNEVTFLYQR